MTGAVSNSQSSKQDDGDGESENYQDFKLEKDNELRFEVESNAFVKLEVQEGKAEIYGTELVNSRVYEFGSNAKIAVFTWFGCSIRLSGKWEAAYPSKDTPMTIYLNTHGALETKRKKCAENDDIDEIGPKVLVVGPQDVGKSVVCRTLLNYAVRFGSKPTLIDIDVGQSAISIPGTVGALTIDRPADPVDSFDHKQPIVYHFGHTSPNGNIKLYYKLVQRLAHVFEVKCSANSDVRRAGCIIDTCGWIKGQGYKCILHTALCFKADVVLVIDSERLFNDLKRDLPHFVDVISLPKSPGVVERSRQIRRETRDDMIKEYFYGPRKILYPHSFDLGFDEIQIYKIGAPDVPDSVLPLGMEQEDTQTKLVPVSPSTDIIYHILSMSMAESLDEVLTETNVGGFLVVTKVDTTKRVLEVLSPAPKPLPRSYFLMMDIRYVEK